MKAVTKTVLPKTCKNKNIMQTRTLAIMTAVTLGVTGLLATAQDNNPPPLETNPPAEALHGRPGPGPGTPRPGNRPPRSPLEAALDADGDGIISAEEIANAPAALRKLDHDGNGKLTAADYAPHRPPLQRDQPPAGFNPPGPRREHGPGGPAGMAGFGPHHFAGGPGEPGAEPGRFGGGPRRFPGHQAMPAGGPEAEFQSAGGFPGRPHPPMEQPEGFGGDRPPFPPRPEALQGGPGMRPHAPGFGPENFDRPGPGPRAFGTHDLNSRDEAGRPGEYPPELRPFRGDENATIRRPGGPAPQMREEGRRNGDAAPHHAPRPWTDGEDFPPQPPAHLPPPQY